MACGLWRQSAPNLSKLNKNNEINYLIKGINITHSFLAIRIHHRSFGEMIFGLFCWLFWQYPKAEPAIFVAGERTTNRLSIQNNRESQNGDKSLVEVQVTIFGIVFTRNSGRQLSWRSEEIRSKTEEGKGQENWQRCIGLHRSRLIQTARPMGGKHIMSVFSSIDVHLGRESM